MLPGHLTIGRCSLCGGEVTVPHLWLGVIPPAPTCSSCGAVAAPPELPVIPMEPSRQRSVVTTTTGTSQRSIEAMRQVWAEELATRLRPQWVC